MDGSVEYIFKIVSSLPEDLIGYTSRSLDMDGQGNVYGVANFFNKAPFVYSMQIRSGIL